MVLNNLKKITLACQKQISYHTVHEAQIKLFKFSQECFIVLNAATCK